MRPTTNDGNQPADEVTPSESYDHWGIAAFGLAVMQPIVTVLTIRPIIYHGAVKPELSLPTRILGVIAISLPAVILLIGAVSMTRWKRRLRFRGLGVIGLLAGVTYIALGIWLSVE